MKIANLTEQLTEAGLNEKEAEVYLSALELGRSSILEIAQHSKVKRSTVYEIIPVLENRGLIKRTKIGKKDYFVGENPKTVLTIIKEKEKRFHEALPQLMSLFNAQEKRPKVYFYQGPEELKQMYEDTLRERKPLLNYTSIINLYQYLPREWVDDYIKRRIALRIKTRLIALDSPESREWAKTAKEELREVRLIPRENYDFSADVHIYGNKVIVTTYKSGLFGLLIEDENIAQMQRIAFELMWEGAEKYQNKPEIVETREKSYDIIMTQEILEQKIVEAVKASPYRDYIQSISLFGSYLHGGAGKDSDVDLLYVTRKPMTLFQIGGLNYYLAQKLGRKVDLVPKNSVIVQLRDKIIPEAKKIYEIQRR